MALAHTNPRREARWMGVVAMRFMGSYVWVG